MNIDECIGAALRDRSTFTIVGGSGFVGTHLAAFLARRGLAHRCLPRDAAEPPAGPLGHVLYAAGVTADFARRPHDAVEAHVTHLSRVLERCEYDSLVYLSSTRLYDATPGGGREDAPLLLDPRNPRHVFDLSKALGECLCIHAGRSRARVARLSSVYAEDLSGTNFLHELVRAAACGAETRIDTSPSYERDYVDVEDVCALVVAIAVAGTRPIYNVACGENVSNARILDWLADAAGRRLTATRDAQPLPSPHVDITAAAAEFGYRPRMLSDRIGALVAAARSQGA